MLLRLWLLNCGILCLWTWDLLIQWSPLKSRSRPVCLDLFYLCYFYFYSVLFYVCVYAGCLISFCEALCWRLSSWKVPYKYTYLLTFYHWHFIDLALLRPTPYVVSNLLMSICPLLFALICWNHCAFVVPCSKLNVHHSFTNLNILFKCCSAKWELVKWYKHADIAPQTRHQQLHVQ